MKATNLKKLLRLTTVCLLLAAMLAGCWGNKTPEETEGNNPVETESTGANTPEPTDAPPETTVAPVETEPETTSVMATVNTDLLNVRTGPSTDTAVAGQLSRGAKIEILEQTDVDGVAWGRTEVGWVCLDFLVLDTEGSTPDDTAEPTEAPDADSDTEGTKGTITATSLHIRKGTGTAYDSVGKYSKGDTVIILEQKTVDGTTWGRTDKGWISLKYVDLDGTVSNDTSNDNDDDKKESDEDLVSDGSTKVLGYGVVRNGLNIRYGPGKDYGVIETIRGGSRVAYYEKSNGWIRIKEGWVSLSYIYVEGDKGEDGCTGTITADSLNVRQGPGTGFDSIGKLVEGDEVTILEQITVDGSKWGYTGEGWISMKYVDED